MRHLIECREDNCTGELGLALKAMPRLDNGEPETGGGLVIAHDLLEHVGGVRAIGGIGDEIQALGAAWYVRFKHGVNNPADPYAGAARSSEEHVASDISRFALMVAQGEHVGIPTPRTRSHAYDSEFESILQHARREAREEARALFDEADKDGILRELDESYWPCVIPHLRAGYNKAHKRYRGREVLFLFFEIQRLVDRLCKPEYEGQQWALSLNIDRQRVSVSELYEED